MAKKGLEPRASSVNAGFFTSYFQPRPHAPCIHRQHPLSSTATSATTPSTLPTAFQGAPLPVCPSWKEECGFEWGALAPHPAGESVPPWWFHEEYLAGEARFLDGVRRHAREDRLGRRGMHLWGNISLKAVSKPARSRAEASISVFMIMGSTIPAWKGGHPPRIAEIAPQSWRRDISLSCSGASLAL